MNFKKTLLALLLTFALLFTLTVPAFATESGDSATGTESVAEPEGSAEETDPATDAETDKAETDGETTEAETDDETGTAVNGSTEDEMTWGEWVSIGIGAAILLILLVLAILFITAKDDPDLGKNGEKVPFRVRGKRFFRSCKSEAKKVVWTPGKTVRKNTLVVLVVIVVFAILIGLLDVVFSEGISALASLMNMF